MAMSIEPKTDSDWTPCPEGTLQGMVGRLRARRRRTIAVRAACAAGVVAAILLAAGFVSTRHASDDYLHGGLYCSQVRPALPDYRAGKLHGEFLSQVEQHLAECPPCRRALNALNGESASAPHGHFRGHLALAQSDWLRRHDTEFFLPQAAQPRR